jgi:outer membrane protein OmpA-like peptidoglycan-associated protein
MLHMKNFNLKVITICCLYVSAAAIFPGCSTFTKTEKGAAIGAAGGGIVGAFIGRATGNTAIGALVGGAVGGTAGGLIGHKMDKQAAEIKQTVPGATVTREGEGIVVKFDSGILFDVDKTNLKPDAENSLNQLAVSLQNNPQTNILVIGHTDSTGTAAHNIDLSVRRASAVKSYIVQQGVNGGRLTTEGKGETEPIASNNTVQGRAQNRRVEIVIIANDQMKQQAAQGN